MKFKFKGATKYGRRHKPGEMNQTEQRYAHQLECAKQTGAVIAWAFEPLKLKLASDCFYTPDFLVLWSDGSLTLVDVKGGGPIDDKSVVKIKVAAAAFFWFDFVMIQAQTKKEGAGWNVKFSTRLTNNEPLVHTGQP